MNDDLKQVTKEKSVNLLTLRFHDEWPSQASDLGKICQPWKERKIGVDPLPSPATPASLIDSYFGSNPPQISLTAVQFVNSLKNPNIK